MDLVLWHINHCRLLNAKSSLYLYIKYVWFCLVGFYGISTIVGYLMPNPLYTYILNIYNLVWFGWVLWYINHCRLFNAKSSLYIYVVPSISFQTFFVQAFRSVVDSWKFSILLLYILWHDWPIFMISASNEQLQQELEYTLLKPDCHSWWISKNAIWTWGHFRRTICNKILF